MMLDCHTKSFGKGHHTRSQNMLYFVDSQDLFGIHLECHECGFIFKGANYVVIIRIKNNVKCWNLSKMEPTFKAFFVRIAAPSIGTPTDGSMR